MKEICGGHFHCSPLIVSVLVQGPGVPDKYCVCRHLSKEYQGVASVNSYIDKELHPTRFDTARRTEEFVAQAPVGTQLCTRDLAKFHRTIPVNPHHKPWLVFQGRTGDFYMDHVMPFGAACASSNTGQVANAIVDIWHARGIGPILKYEDDLNISRAPISLPHKPHHRYAYSFGDMVQAIQDIDAPWHPPSVKGDSDFADASEYTGFLWDLKHRTVGLTEPKRLKFLNRVLVFRSRFCTKGSMAAMQLHDIMSIHGLLCHVAFVLLEGVTYLPALSTFSAKFKGNKYVSHYAETAVVTEINWWATKLLVKNLARPIRVVGQMAGHRIFVDASTDWGIGVEIDGKWAAFQLVPNWKTPGRVVLP